MSESTTFARRWYPTAAMFYINGAGYGVWATQILLAKNRLGLDAMVLGRLLVLLGLGAVVAMVASGWIIRRLGTGGLTRISALLFVAMLPIICVAPSVTTLGIALFLFGACGGSMDVGINAHAAEVEQRYGKHYMSSFHGMWSLGGLSGAGLGGALLFFVGGPAQALVLSAFLAVVYVFGQRGLLARTPPAAGERHASLRPTAAALLIGALAAVVFASEGAILDWASVYLNGSLGAEPAVATLGYAAFAGAMAAARFLGDAVRRRFGGPLLVQIGGGLAIVGLLAGPVSGNAVLAIAGFGLAGLGLSNVVPVLFSAAGAQPNPDGSIAVVSTMGYSGLLLAPPLLGVLAHYSSLGMIFVASALGCLVMTLVAGLLNPRRQAVRSA